MRGDVMPGAAPASTQFARHHLLANAEELNNGILRFAKGVLRQCHVCCFFSFSSLSKLDVCTRFQLLGHPTP